MFFNNLFYFVIHTIHFFILFTMTMHIFFIFGQSTSLKNKIKFYSYLLCALCDVLYKITLKKTEINHTRFITQLLLF